MICHLSITSFSSSLDLRLKLALSVNQVSVANNQHVKCTILWLLYKLTIEQFFLINFQIWLKTLCCKHVRNLDILIWSAIVQLSLCTLLIETLEAPDLHTQRHVDLQKHFARFAYENPILICILRETYTSPAAPLMSGDATRICVQTIYAHSIFSTLGALEVVTV